MRQVEAVESRCVPVREVRIGLCARSGRQLFWLALQTHASSRRTPFTFLDNGFASSAALAAFSAHSAFGFCAHAETSTPDNDPDPRSRAFLDNSASLRARF